MAFGLPLPVILLWTSAFFFILGLLLTLKPFLRERTILMTSFFVYLLGMALMHIFLGGALLVSGLTAKIFIIISFFSAVTASAYVSRFTLYTQFPDYEKKGFFALLAIGWLIILYSLFLPFKEIISGITLYLVFGYMIIVAGIFTGLYMVWVSLRQKEYYLRIKGFFGGLGISTCCLLADVLALIYGVSIIAESFMILSPILIVFGIFYGRLLEKRSKFKGS